MKSNDERIDAITIILYIICSFSFLSCFLILLSFFMFPLLRTPSGLFSTWISICGMGMSLFPFFGEPKNGSLLCNIQGFIGTYFVLVRIIVSALLTNILYLLLYPSKKFGGKKISKIRITIGHTILTWGIPGLISSLPLISTTFAKDSGDRYCWIESKEGRRSEIIIDIAFGLFYGAVWLITIYNITTFYYIIQRSKHPSMDQINLTSSQYIHTITQKLKWYPILSIIIWIVPTFHRICEFLSWEPYPLSLISLLIYSSLGFMDSLVYFNSSRAYTYWCELIQKIFKYGLICNQKSFNDTDSSLLSPGSGSGSGSGHQRGGGGGGEGEKMQSSSSTSRVIYHKRIKYSKQLTTESPLETVTTDQDNENNENDEIINPSSYQLLDAGEDEEGGSSNSSDSDSDEDEDEDEQGREGEGGGEVSDILSLLSWTNHRGRKKKNSFLDLDFPVTLHHNDE